MSDSSLKHVWSTGSDVSYHDRGHWLSLGCKSYTGVLHRFVHVSQDAWWALILVMLPEAWTEAWQDSWASLSPVLTDEWQGIPPRRYRMNAKLHVDLVPKLMGFGCCHCCSGWTDWCWTLTDFWGVVFICEYPYIRMFVFSAAISPDNNARRKTIMTLTS